MMRVPEAFQKFNVAEVARLQTMRDNANNLNKAARRLKGGMFYVFFSRAQARERKRLHDVMLVVELALVELDYEIIDFYRVTAEPGQGPNIDLQWFALQMRVRAFTRDAVLRYVNDARAWISDLQMAAMVRATLIVSVAALLVAVASVAYERLDGSSPDRSAGRVDTFPSRKAAATADSPSTHQQEPATRAANTSQKESDRQVENNCPPPLISLSHPCRTDALQPVCASAHAADLGEPFGCWAPRN